MSSQQKAKEMGKKKQKKELKYSHQSLSSFTQPHQPNPLNSMATFSISLFFLLFMLSSLTLALQVQAASTPGPWCVARSEATDQALQAALDYACSAGADCTPILSNGLCFLPNTLQAHASYAFNSYFQRRAMAPGACDFSGTATLAKTDPSYGSCVYPSSLSTAGGATTPSTGSSTNSPTTSTTPMPTTLTPANGDGTAGLNPGLTPPLPTDDDNGTPLQLKAPTLLMPFSLLLVYLLAF